MKSSVNIAIWDFDGTMYPIAPYDCEQYLLHLRKKQLPLYHSVGIDLRIMLDRKQMFSRNFKRFYIRKVSGSSKLLIDECADYIASLVPPEQVNAYRYLHEKGWQQYIFSCGTFDICSGVVNRLGISDCFREIYSNKFIFDSHNRIESINITVPDGLVKLQLFNRLVKESIAGEAGTLPFTAVFGDGYTDIPIMESADFACLIHWNSADMEKPKYRGMNIVPYPSDAVNLLMKELQTL